MAGFVIFAYVASIAMSTMALGLAIVSRMFHKEPWTGRYIVLQSSLVGVLTIGVARMLSLVFMAESIRNIINFVFDGIIRACVAYILVFIPYFVSWIIARPWRKKQRAFFYPLAIAYFLFSVGEMVTDYKGLFYVTTALILVVYTFCIVILWSNLKSIEDKQTRSICLAINIVSLSLIALAAPSIFYPAVAQISHPLYGLAFSILMLVYFFCKLRTERVKQENKPGMSLESLETYRITEREYSVIKLICEGLTNKEIASELYISVNTVNNHVANIFEKMNVRSRIDLLRLLQEGPGA